MKAASEAIRRRRGHRGRSAARARLCPWTLCTAPRPRRQAPASAEQTRRRAPGRLLRRGACVLASSPVAHGRGRSRVRVARLAAARRRLPPAPDRRAGRPPPRAGTPWRAATRRATSGPRALLQPHDRHTHRASPLRHLRRVGQVAEHAAPRSIHVAVDRRDQRRSAPWPR